MVSQAGRLRRSRTAAGFTLVELIVVILILGVLAATAVPRFINIQREARIAVVEGFAGGLRSASNLVQAAWVLQNGVSPVIMGDGTAVTVTASGFPTTGFAGIGAAMRCESTTACNGAVVGFGLSATFRPANGGGANCQAFYTAAGTVFVSTSTC